MKLTITVRKTAAPQTVQTIEGPTIVQPGQSITAEVNAAQAAYLRAAPGHFEVSGADAGKHTK